MLVMATTHAARTVPYARRGTPLPRVRVYDQEAESVVPERRRVAHRDPVGVRGSTHDLVVRWVAAGSLALVTLLVALVILQ